MPTAAATSSTVIDSKPFCASSRLAVCTMASSRAASICALKEGLAVETVMPKF